MSRPTYSFRSNFKLYEGSTFLVLSTLVLLLFLPTQVVFAQNQKADVKATILNLFKGMYDADSALVASTFHPDARLMTVRIDKEGNRSLVTEEISKFTSSIASIPKNQLDEQLLAIDIKEDGLLATAWTPYTFIYNGKVSHSGVNIFQLFNSQQDGWQIIQVTDTRRPAFPYNNRSAFRAGREQQVVKRLDAWHQAATDANYEDYFGIMADSSIFIGTDASEYWTKKEFQAFSKPYFDKGKAWSFTANRRVVYLNEAADIAWFDEDLDTWMGVCRGSGVLKFDGQKWYLHHYVLSMTIPNESVQSVLDILKPAKEK